MEYDAIFDELYAASIGEMYTGTTSIPYTIVKSIHNELLRKQDTIWKIDANNLSFRSLQDVLLLFLEKLNDFGNKNEEFYNPSIKTIVVTINGIPHQLFQGAFQARGIYPEPKKYLYKENSDVTWTECLTKKIALWIDTRSSIDNTPRGSRRAVNQGIILQIDKASETGDGKLMCYVFSLEDAVAHLSVTDHSGILTTEK